MAALPSYPSLAAPGGIEGAAKLLPPPEPNPCPGTKPDPPQIPKFLPRGRCRIHPPLGPHSVTKAGHKFGWKPPGFRGAAGKRVTGAKGSSQIHATPPAKLRVPAFPAPKRLPGLRLAGKSSLLLKSRRQQGEHKQHLHILNSILAPLGLFLSRQKHNRSARPEKGQGKRLGMWDRRRENKSRAWEWLRSALLCHSPWRFVPQLGRTQGRKCHQTQRRGSEEGTAHLGFSSLPGWKKQRG